MQPHSIIGQAAQSMNSGQPVMDQVSHSAPTFQQGLQTPPATPMPDGSPMTPLHRALSRRGMQPPAQMQQPQAPTQEPMTTLPIQDGNPQQPGVQVPATEAELIIKALTTRLSHHSKNERQIMDAMIPPQEAQPQ